MSSSMAFLRSPKPGALTAQEMSVPFSLFKTNVDRASPVTSLAMTSKGLPVWATFSKSGMSSMAFLSSRSVMRM